MGVRPRREASGGKHTAPPGGSATFCGAAPGDAQHVVFPYGAPAPARTPRRSYTTLTGLIDSVASPSSLDAETNVRIAASFDHEEVGSSSVPGAGAWLVLLLLCGVSA
jgi:hypothetical protein